MKNPYRLHEGDYIPKIHLNAIIFPGAVFAHTFQANRESNLHLKERIKNYANASLCEGLKLVAFGSLAHNLYELVSK